MGSSMDTLIARGLPAIDTAGDYYKLQNQQLEHQQNLMALANARQLQPLKIQAAEQLAQENALKLDAARRNQAGEARYQEMMADPQYGRDPYKVHAAAAIDPAVPFDIWGQHGEVLGKLRDEADKTAKSEQEREQSHRQMDAQSAVGVAYHDYDPVAYEGMIHTLRDQKRITDDQALAYINAAKDPVTGAQARRSHTDEVILKHAPTATEWRATKDEQQNRITGDTASAAQEAPVLRAAIAADPQNAGSIYQEFLGRHAGVAPKLPKTYRPGIEDLIEGMGIPAEKRAEWMQARNTATADAARTPEEWHKLIVASVGPDRAPAVTAMVDAESNPTKKRLLIEKIGERRPAEDSLAREATNILTKPEAQRTPEEKARLKAIQQQTTMFRPPPADHGENIMVPNAQGGYTLTRLMPGQTAGPGAVTKGGMSTANTLPAQTRATAVFASSVMDQIPTVLAEVDELKNKIGPVAGRWEQFWVNKGGKDDPAFAGLDQDLHMLASAIVRVHFGMKGGKDLVQALEKQFGEAQSAEDLKARIQHAETWVKGYANPTQPGQAKPAKPAAPATGGKKGDPLGVL